MIRLILVFGIAIALWPLDEANRPLGIGVETVSFSDVIGASQSVVVDLASFCERNPETCNTVSTATAEIAGKVQSSLIELGNTANVDASEDASE